MHFCGPIYPFHNHNYASGLDDENMKPCISYVVKESHIDSSEMVSSQRDISGGNFGSQLECSCDKGNHPQKTTKRRYTGQYSGYKKKSTQGSVINTKRYPTINPPNISHDM